MSRRAAIVTQADVERLIRAVQARGLPVIRVVARADGVAVETTPLPPPDELETVTVEDFPEIVL